MSSEIWRDIRDLPGYQVSDLGRVRSVGADRPGLLPVGALKGTGGRSSGYPTVSFEFDDRRIQRRLHRLVTEAFIGPRPDGMVTRHLNGNKLDNRLANLVYGTLSENMQDTVRHGQHNLAKRTHCANGHALTEDNIYRAPKRPTVRACLKCQRAVSARNAKPKSEISPVHAAARRWAIDQGMEVSDRGPLKAAVMDAYLSAQSVGAR